MSGYEPRKGDRVRVVLEGEVRPDMVDGQFWLGRDHLVRLKSPLLVSVEKLPDPIPTTVGTVLWIDGDTWQRYGAAWNSTGIGAAVGDADVQKHADRAGFTVLREGKR